MLIHLHPLAAGPSTKLARCKIRVIGSGTLSQEKMQGILDETEELIAIFTASVKTAKERKP